MVPFKITLLIMQFQYILFGCLFIKSVCDAEKFEYIIMEHPEVTYYSRKYASFANLTSRRYGRHDPFYYVGIHINSLRTMANNVTVDVYIYEWLTNVYKRSFVEMHFRLCDLIQKDLFFGTNLKQGKLLHPCPYLPGEYHLYNITIPVKHIPPHFPFRKGRIYLNVTSTDENELMAHGHVDMEIKDFSSRLRKIQKKLLV